MMRGSYLFAGWLAAALVVAPAVDGARAELPPGRKPHFGFDDLPTGPYRDGFIDSWRWTKEFRDEARRLSKLEIVDTPGAKGCSLRIRVDDSRVVAGPPNPLYRIIPYLQPHAYLVARVQVVSGEVGLYVGGPTAYYANSDVYTEPRKLRAHDPPEWVEVPFNLNHPTWRNFRRAGFSTEAPRNYYLRWAQEPLGIFLTADSKGEVLIDWIESMTIGEGGRFGRNDSPSDSRRLQTIADFEPIAPKSDATASDDKPAAETDRDRAFNLYMAADEAEWFDESWRRSKPLRFAPLKLSVVAQGFEGKASLACTGRTAEEVQCTGVRTTGNAAADAIYVELKATGRSNSSTLLNYGPALPIDFLVFIGPPQKAGAAAKPFDWARFGPSAELRKQPGPGFDYQLSHRTLRDVKDVDFAIYHARRFVPPGAWKKLTLHRPDFTCVYGHGALRRNLLDHEPLKFDDVIAVAWLRPWCRAGRSEDDDTTMIDELSFVKTNANDAAGEGDWWQVPDVKSLISREGTMAGQKTLHLALPDDLAPPDALRRANP